MSALALLTACPLPINCNPLDDLAGAAAGDAASSVFTALTSWLAGGAGALVDHVLALVSGPTIIPSVRTGGEALTSPDLGVTWFARQQRLMVELMGLVMLPILFISTIGCILRQDLHRLARTWFVALPLALVCGIVGVELTEIGLRATDALTSVVLSGADPTRAIGDAIGAMTAPGTGPVVTGIVAVLAVVGGVFLWLELVVRTTAVYIAVFFLPLAMSGLVWPTTTRMARRLVELVVALVLSKFVVAAVLSLGAAAVGQGGIDGALSGVAILMIASFAPFLLFRMVPIIEAAALAHMEGASRRPFHAASRMAQSAARPANHPLVAALRSHAAPPGRSPMGAAQVVGQAVAQHEGEYPSRPPAGPDASRPPAGPEPSAPARAEGPAAPSPPPSSPPRGDRAERADHAGVRTTTTDEAGTSRTSGDSRSSRPSPGLTAVPRPPSGPAGGVDS